MFSINKNMKDIYNYITLAKEERQSHLKLEEACIERGAGSYYFKGLLAHCLDTTVPTGHKIHLCHACNNGACGNPNHMYWGSASENAIDRMNNGDKTIWEKMVEKYGYDEACKINSKGKNGNTYGSGNKGKPKSEEHKKKIALNRKGGRKKKEIAGVS
jgi:hypothetical protein